MLCKQKACIRYKAEQCASHIYACIFLQAAKQNYTSLHKSRSIGNEFNLNQEYINSEHSQIHLKKHKELNFLLGVVRTILSLVFQRDCGTGDGNVGKIFSLSYMHCPAALCNKNDIISKHFLRFLHQYMLYRHKKGITNKAP